MVTAVTGGIGEGKSTVLGYLAESGFKVLSADSLGKAVFSDPIVNGEIADLTGFGRAISPVELRQVLFTRPEIRRAVNRIMHPRIVSAIFDARVDFVEVPLLIETCLQGAFDEVWVVTCGLEEQRKRLLLRYGPDAPVDQIIGAQLPSAAKIPFADTVIRTNCEHEAVRRNVSLALQRRLGTG